MCPKQWIPYLGNAKIPLPHWLFFLFSPFFLCTGIDTLDVEQRTFNIMYSPRRKPVLKTSFDISPSPNRYNYTKPSRKRGSPSPKRLPSTTSTQQDSNDMSLDEYVESKRKRAKLAPSAFRQRQQHTASNIPSHLSVNTSKPPVHTTASSKRRPTYPPRTATAKFNRTSFVTKPAASSTRTHAFAEIKPSACSPKITVCVRKRPLNKYELSTNQPDVTELPSSNTIEIHAPKYVYIYRGCV